MNYVQQCPQCKSRERIWDLECYECNAEGYVWNDNDKEVECDTCLGDGYFYGELECGSCGYQGGEVEFEVEEDDEEL